VLLTCVNCVVGNTAFADHV